MTDPEPWDIAAQREHGLRDGLALLLLATGALAWALLPPIRLVALTGLRLATAALLASATLVTGGILAQALSFAAHGFLILALFSLAAHVEAVTLGPLVEFLLGASGARTAPAPATSERPQDDGRIHAPGAVSLGTSARVQAAPEAPSKGTSP